MKISIFTIASYSLLFIISFLFSCKENNSPIDLLIQAQSIVEDNPKEALILIDSIQNPESMDKDSYMQFVVAHFQAKLKADKDVINDTLIFEAKKYFENNKNPDQAALANFYTGNWFRKKQMYDKALQCYLEATKYGKQANNNTLVGRSLNNTGSLFFDRGAMDSAIVRYQEALEYYAKGKKTDVFKLQTLNSIGRSYEVLGTMDSAYFYFKKVFEIANEINNQEYKIIATANLGLVFQQTGEYEQAANYFQKALAKSPSTIDSSRIYLNLAKLYIATNQLDSTRYYTDLLKARLSEIKDNYVCRSIYESLYNYNKEIGNYQEALYYSGLQKEVNQKIEEINNSNRLVEVEKQYQISMLQKEMDRLQIRSYIYVSVAASVIVLIMILTWFKTKNSRLKHAQEVEKNKLLEQQLQNLLFLRSIYHNIISEWTTIERDVKKLTAEYRVKEEPPIYRKIKQMVGDLTFKTNLQLIENAKDLLKKEPSGDKALEVLDDRELLILMLSYCGYNKKEMSIILGELTGTVNLHIQKLDIQSKLLDVGMPLSNTNRILFSINSDNK